MKNALKTLCDLADSFGVREISNVVLGDARFPLWSGASKSFQHHYGTGGLALHTLEVVELCLMNNGYFLGHKCSNEKHLFLAALFHDAGKMWDYEPTRFDPSYNGERIALMVDELLDANNRPRLCEWRGANHKRNIHHISRSGLVWHDAVEKTGMFKDAHDEIYHAILAHHGNRQWGSPVSPATRIAWLLHLCDSISARIDDCDRMGFDGKEKS